MACVTDLKKKKVVKKVSTVEPHGPVRLRRDQLKSAVLDVVKRKRAPVASKRQLERLKDYLSVSKPA